MMILLKMKNNKKQKMEQKLVLKVILRMETVRRFPKVHQELKLKVALTSKMIQAKTSSPILQNKNQKLIVNRMH